MNPARSGHHGGMDEPSVELISDPDDQETAQLRVVGEMTEAARRPLVRVVTDLLLGHPKLRRLRIDLCEVGFMDSQGMAALVQVERMAQPRGITVELELQHRAVARPLQLSGLWSRFTVIDHRAETPEQTSEPLPPGDGHR